MSNRLQIFRERMAAFEGAANPQEAIESGYYVRTPGKLLAEKLSARVALRPASSHLLIGGIGSGKTTQLLVACERLKEIGDIYPIYIDVSLHTDISEITPGVLTAIAGVELSKLLEDSKDSSIQFNINEVRKIAYGYSENLNISDYLFSSSIDRENLPHNTIKKHNKGVIASKNSNNLNNHLQNAVNKLLSYAANNYGNIVLLFDGLDRFHDDKIIPEIINLDIKFLSNSKIGVVIVAPLSSRYTEKTTIIENYLDYFYPQPFFDIDNNSEAYEFFIKVLKARSQDSFLEEVAIDLLIKFSGGVLRDLINLTQSAIEETYISGDEKILEKHVFDAVKSFGKSKILGISNHELEILQNIMKEGKFIPRTEQDIKLLITRCIIEYVYPKQRYAVHPAIEPIIEQIYA